MYNETNFSIRCEVHCMDFVTAKEKAAEWNISLRRVQVFCERGRIDGVQRFGKVWVIPKDAKRPLDLRYSKNKLQRACRERS
jgi:hypothetical protein